METPEASMSANLPVKDKSGESGIIKIAPFKSTVWKTEPHRHNGYLEMIFLSEGAGVHLIDGREFQVSPPVLFVIRRDQVHCWDLTAAGEGYVLLIKKEFMDSADDPELRSLLTSVSVHNCLLLQQNRTVASLLDILLEELAQQKEGRIPLFAKALLKALLAKTMEIARPVTKLVKDPDRLYQRFLHLLSDQSALKQTVQNYADLLHTTPQNLNNICRKETDRTATEVLGEFIVSEAKRLLLYTNKTVSEISYALDFKDPSHFVKYFKRMTGGTPQRFRQGA